MANKQKAAPSPAVQRRASAGSAGKNAAKSFSSVNPVQKKDDAIQRNELEEKLSMSAEPAQMNVEEEKIM